MNNIHLLGYPRSGTTWLTRLLGDALNCPTASTVGNPNDVVAEGHERPSPYIVCREHMEFKRFQEYFPNYQRSIVMIVRDPRDVAVSHKHYFERPLVQMVARMCGGIESSPLWSDWNRYYKEWMEQNRYNVVVVRYESLLNSTRPVLDWVLEELNIEFDPDRLDDAIHRQSFAVRKQYTLDNIDTLHMGKDQLRYIRRGEAGVWAEELNAKLEKRLVEHCSEMMKVFWYE